MLWEHCAYCRIGIVNSRPTLCSADARSDCQLRRHQPAHARAEDVGAECRRPDGYEQSACDALPVIGSPHVLHAVCARGTWSCMALFSSAATVVLLRHTCAASSRDCAILWHAACPPVEACGRAIDEGGSRGVLSALGTSRMPSAGAEYCSGAFAVLPVCTLRLA